jgi:hypothetical protein
MGFVKKYNLFLCEYPDTEYRKISIQPNPITQCLTPEDPRTLIQISGFNGGGWMRSELLTSEIIKVFYELSSRQQLCLI